MASNIPDQPVVAEAHIYQTSDTVGPAGGAGDAGGNDALSKILSESLLERGRTTSAPSGGGFVVTLDAELAEAYCWELVDLKTGPDPGGTDPVGIKIITVVRDGGAVITAQTAGYLARTPEIFTGQDDPVSGSNILNPVSVRCNAIPGYDAMTTPSSSSPGNLSSFAAKTITVTLDAAGTDHWEFAHFALGVNARRITSVSVSRFESKQVRLRDGYGRESTSSWNLMPMAEAEYLKELWSSTDGGQRPFFFFPAPGRKSATGVLTETEQTPSTRGGLVRLLEAPSFREAEPPVGAYTARDVRLRVETWQEVPSS